MIRLKSILILTALWLSVQNSIGQPLAAFLPDMSYPFVNEEANVISNNVHLDSLMEKLYNLKVHGHGTINILHIGDSHLQADFMTSVIRTKLQKEFGNGGRGLVVPLHVAKTNEPDNYKSTSNFSWQSKRCVFPNQPLPIGIGGVTISTTDSCADFTIKTMDDLPQSYGFNKMTLFYQKDSASYGFTLSDSLGVCLGLLSPDSLDVYPFTSSVAFPVSTNQVTVKVTNTCSQKSRATIYGLLLENGNTGIIYNTVGVNGAEYQHYSEASDFCKQTKALKPDLIIISLGTNEAYALNFDPETFYADIQLLFNQLKKENPKAQFLLTTPACSYRRKKPNLRLPLAGKTIIRFVTDNNLAYWDLQGATGGSNSAINWRKNHMLRPDGVHYSRAGYELQANLFCNAFLNAYNAYVSNRSK